jgi:signal transduction histidine kinase
VRLDHGEGGARVAVTDTGVGVAPEDQPRIFERFFKADPARNREAGGSGLGPALVKKIVELHGGTVGVQSALGRGSTFVVTLPAGPRIPAVGGDTV